MACPLLRSARRTAVPADSKSRGNRFCAPNQETHLPTTDKDMIVKKSKLFTAWASVLAVALSATIAWSADSTDTSADAKKPRDAKKTAAPKRKKTPKYAKGPAGRLRRRRRSPMARRSMSYWWQRLNEAFAEQSATQCSFRRHRLRPSEGDPPAPVRRIGPPPFDGPPFPIRIGKSAAVRMSSAIQAPCGTLPGR
jgi:hypothetical protein